MQVAPPVGAERWASERDCKFRQTAIGRKALYKFSRSQLILAGQQ